MDEQRELEILTGIQSRLMAMATEVESLEAATRQYRDLERCADFLFRCKVDLRAAAPYLEDVIARLGQPDIQRSQGGRPLTTKFIPIDRGL